MKKFFIILGLLILLFVILSNFISLTLSTPLIILLCVISAVFLCIGVLSKESK